MQPTTHLEPMGLKAHTQTRALARAPVDGGGGGGELRAASAPSHRQLHVLPCDNAQQHVQLVELGSAITAALAVDAHTSLGKIAKQLQANPQLRLHIAELLRTVTFRHGTRIAVRGSAADRLWFLRAGGCKVVTTLKSPAQLHDVTRQNKQVPS